VLALLRPIIVKVFGHIIPTELILALIVIYLAYIIGTLIRTEDEIKKDIMTLRNEIVGSGVELIGPHQMNILREKIEEGSGEIWFFNIPLGRMRTDEGFDTIVKAGLENPNVTGITFLLSGSVKDIWKEHVQPRIDAIKHNKHLKVKWLAETNSLAFLLLKGCGEAFTYPLEEPFIASTPKGAQTMMMFHVNKNPEFASKLEEIFEKHLLTAED
jgi:hypothetical protein